MDKKELQEQRMKGYFIDATKEILKSEGLKSLSVRNIAEKAGYSFATLYNYFPDVKHLVFYCVRDFREECRAYVQSRLEGVTKGKKRIRAIVLAYMEYFVQYPGIFELFFIEKLSDIDHQKETAGLIVHFLQELCEEDWAVCAAKKVYTDVDIQLKQSQLSIITTGILVLYMHRNTPGNYKACISLVNAQMDQILN
ncbi:TetR family transcriptional regulator [Chitinophaga skermanii]|uniref:TetR family transcriptional regulator n=1 Tax=Chitinophaga skermanii TaxID=331697 RepID=A0A327QCZ3_9BACT|nr:TetR/AcrR family transcriptional regulator [Chitinophaga skermanii]RAJ02439.1 TetR family transcriptional regulator [Chitinophaga skermanii]